MNKQSLLSLYYSYIHSYINYANVTWESTYMTNVKILISRQKHVMRIICNKRKFEHTKQLFYLNKILNVYKLNILYFGTFTYKVNQKTAPNVVVVFFFSIFQKPCHFYPTRFSELSSIQPIYKLKQVNTQFQLEDHISGIAFLVPKGNKSLLFINLKLYQNRDCSF